MPAIYDGENLIKKSDLILCPFCGGRELVMYTNDEEIDSSDFRFYVHCIPCDVNGPTAKTRWEALEKWGVRYENNSN